jgi:hypothetical protein
MLQKRMEDQFQVQTACASGALTRPTIAMLWVGALVSLTGWAASMALADDHQTAPAAKTEMKVRAKSSISRQPRPLSAPIKPLGRQADTAVTLLGIETAVDSEGDRSATSLLDKRAPIGLAIAPEVVSPN